MLQAPTQDLDVHVDQLREAIRTQPFLAAAETTVGKLQRLSESDGSAASFNKFGGDFRKMMISSKPR